MDWKTITKIDITLLLINSIMLGVNIAEKDWIAVALYTALVAYLAAKHNEHVDDLTDLGLAGIALKEAVEEDMKKNEQKKKN